MKKYTTRYAENHEGDRIRELVDPDGAMGLQWDTIYPWWVAVLDEDVIVACAQVIISHPVGHVEFLNMDSKLKPMQRAYAIKKVEEFARTQMYINSVFMARSTIALDVKQRQWRKVVKRHFGKHLFDASVFGLWL